MSPAAGRGGRPSEGGATAGTFEDMDASENASALTAAAPSMRAHASAGHELIPVNGKQPVGRGWRWAPPLPLGEAMARLESGRNVGVRLRATDLVLDIDPRNFPKGDDPLRRLRADFRLPDAPFVRTGGGGLHLYLRKPADRPVVNELDGYPGVEFKSHGRQVVAAGSIHPNGRPYVLDDDPLALSLRDAPEATTELLDAIGRPSAETQVADSGEVTPEQLERLLSRLDVTAYNGRHDAWLAIMMACHHGTGGEGVDEFVAWSTGDPHYADEEDRIRGRWASLSVRPAGRAVTVETLKKALHDAGEGPWIDEVLRTDPREDFKDPPEPAPGPAPEPDVVDRLNERFCAVLSGGFAIFMEDEDANFDPPRKVWTRMSRGDFLHYHENRRVAQIGSRRDLSVAEVWLSSPRRRQYPGIIMDPDARRSDRLNLWQGWAVKARPGDWSLMRRLIEDVLCSGDGASADYVLRWIAFMLQKPGTSPEAAICFRGTEGAGKGTLARALLTIAGAHGLTVSSPLQFAGRFNAHLRSVAFLFADEAGWQGNREAEGILKQLVTESVISYEGKGADIVSGRNLVHLMMASNNEWVVPAGLNARRFAVFDVSDARSNDRGYFGAINAQMRAGGHEAMLHDLLELDLGDWHPSRGIPKTQALAEQKINSLDPASRWWMRALGLGALPAVGAPNWAEGPVELDPAAKAELLEDYDRFLRASRGHGTNASHRALVAAGRSLGLETRRSKGGAERTWWLPPLTEARRLFAERLGARDLFD